MANDNENGQKNDSKDQARNLYFQTALTQAQIAELIGVSQKTVSVWMNDGRWKQLKESAELAPLVLIDQMTSELSELHHNIISREPGKRFATPQEAEIRRKILTSIKYLKEQQTTGVHEEVLSNFINYVRSQNPHDVKIIVVHADEYLTGELKLGIRRPFEPYSLPGQIQIPVPSGFPPADAGPKPTPPDDKKNETDNSSSLNEAA